MKEKRNKPSRLLYIFLNASVRICILQNRGRNIKRNSFQILLKLYFSGSKNMRSPQPFILTRKKKKLFNFLNKTPRRFFAFLIARFPFLIALHEEAICPFFMIKNRKNGKCFKIYRETKNYYFNFDLQIKCRKAFKISQNCSNFFPCFRFVQTF